uniref:Non-ribosomal peptide synthetase n=1 Tax=uncultured bacterium AB_1383 TaxID=1630010 RepID=A0A0E3JNN7_9BACT|nr:non-ribosomal peptide synthetase [uncultured bacterium AB_1383]
MLHQPTAPDGLTADPFSPGSALPASSFQERIWLAERLDPTAALYNVPMAWRVRGRLDADALRQALAALVERHEILRTRFVERGGELVQVVGAPWTPELAREDLVALPAAERGPRLEARLREAAHVRFDLASGRLLAASLFTVAPDEQVLFVCVHHLVWDEASTAVFLRELERCYAAAAGEPVPDAPAPRLAELWREHGDARLAEIGHRLLAWLRPGVPATELEARDLAFHAGRLRDPAEPPRLPRSAARDPRREGERRSAALPLEGMDGVERVAARAGAGVEDVLLAGVLATLALYSGLDDLVVALARPGGALPLRLRLDPAEGFASTGAARGGRGGAGGGAPPRPAGRPPPGARRGPGDRPGGAPAGALRVPGRGRRRRGRRGAALGAAAAGARRGAALRRVALRRRGDAAHGGAFRAGAGAGRGGP